MIASKSGSDMLFPVAKSRSSRGSESVDRNYDRTCIELILALHYSPLLSCGFPSEDAQARMAPSSWEAHETELLTGQEKKIGF